MLAIFVWRLVAKEASHRALPPLFRFFSPFILPRRHYVIATECLFLPSRSPTHADPTLRTDEGYQHGDGGLHPIPSILDLPSLDELEAIDISHGKQTGTGLGSELRNRGAAIDDPLERVKRGGLPMSREKSSDSIEAEETKKDPGEPIRHDADVLTKVIVCESA